MTPAVLADMAPGPFAFGAMALRHGPHEATMRRTPADYLHGGGVPGSRSGSLVHHIRIRVARLVCRWEGSGAPLIPAGPSPLRLDLQGPV